MKKDKKRVLDPLPKTPMELSDHTESSIVAGLRLALEQEKASAANSGRGGFLGSLPRMRGPVFAAKDDAKPDSK